MRENAKLSRLLGALLVIALLVGVAAAQEVTGSINGIVRDASGAVVPNAKVTITNEDRNAVLRTVKTDSNGFYIAPLLPIGKYSVAVEAEGFKQFKRTNIVLNVGDKLTNDINLEVGSNTQSVNVESDIAQVQLQSAEAGGLIDGTQVRELALNGRNWVQLVSLNPGVSDAGNSDQIYVGATAPVGTNVITFSLNGGRREENNYMIDGADNVDRGSNLTLLAFPSVDAIAEFRVIRGQYDPELGRSASGQVNVITKSGTSKLHGSLYEFFRNDALNANSYANKLGQLAGSKPNKPTKLRYHDFGGTIGGPVWIPKIYEQTNKTFFFFSEEARRDINYIPTSFDVPTAAMLQGQFLHPVCNSWSGPGVCNGTGTTVANIDPVAQAYIKDVLSKYPTPNVPTTGDPFAFVSTLRGIYNFREELYKIDHVFSQKFTLSGKILHDSIPTHEPGGLFRNIAVDNVGSTDTNSPGHNYTLHATIAPTSTFLVDAGWAYSYGAILSTPNNTLSAANSPDVAGAVSLPFATTLGRIPSLAFCSGTISSACAVNATTFGPYNDFNQNHQFFGNVTNIRGTHSIKAGATFYHYRKHENAGDGNQGQFLFSGTVGRPSAATPTIEEAIANFLQGQVGTFTQSSLDLTADIRDNQFEWYAQDAWRMKPNFTITYGVRHSVFRQPYDALGMLQNFDPRYWDPAKAPCITATGAIDVTKTPAGVLTSACNPNYSPLNGYIYAKPPAGGTRSPYGNKMGAENWGDFAPRVAFAWDPFKDGKTSIRGGFGMFYDSGFTFGNAEINIFNGIGFNVPLSFSNVTYANLTNGAPIPSTGIPGTATRITSRVDPSGKNPYTQQWSLDVQRQMFGGWLLDVGYYGNNSIHLPGYIDINQPAANTWRGCTAATPCFAGPNSTTGVNFLNSLKDPVSGITYPGYFISGGNTNKLNVLRPYIGYTGADAVRNIYTANYNSLQTQLQKKFSGSTTVNLSYTWSHGLTTDQADRSTGSILPLQYDFRDNYGPTIGDRRHVFTANFVWDLPWLRVQKGFVGHVFGGWEFSGIQTAQTGLPGTVASDQAFDPTGAGCLGPSPCSFRANQSGNPNSGAPETHAAWFNSSVYSNPAPVLLLNGGSAPCPAGSPNTACSWYMTQTSIPTERPGSVRLPGFWRTDLSMFKNFKLTERFGGQFRFETFNLFNHVNPICCSSLTTSSGSYNKITSYRDPRYIELGLKLNF